MERPRRLQHRRRHVPAPRGRSSRASRSTGRTKTGARATLTFHALQQHADRFSNVLAALGIQRGDKVAIILPQRPETAIAHIACYQMGAIAVPLSFLFGPDALEYRLNDAQAKVVLVDAASLPNIAPIRDRLPHLCHVIGVAGARESWTGDWTTLLEDASTRFTPVPTRPTDAALLVYTSGTTGPPKGALMPQQCLLGNLPGFVHSHDGFPQPGDVFWSPADWAWTGGLMDALLPTLYFGYPIVGFRGRFEPERALQLMATHRVRNAFLFPTALKMIMKAIPQPDTRYALRLRSIMSAGEPVGTTVFAWAQEALGVTINEMFGQTEMNYIVGNSHTLWPAKPGSMGRPYPGHRIAVVDDGGAEVPTGTLGEVAMHRIGTDGNAGSRVLSRVLQQPRRNGSEIHRRLVSHGRSRHARHGWIPLVSGARRRYVQGRRIPHRPVRDRELSDQASSGRQRGRGAEPGRGARQRRQGVHRSGAGHRAFADAGARDSATCARSSSRPTSTRRRSNSSTRCR